MGTWAHAKETEDKKSCQSSLTYFLMLNQVEILAYVDWLIKSQCLITTE